MPLILRIPRPSRRALRWTALVLLAATIASAVWILLPFWQLSSHFADQELRQPSRLYGRARLVAEDDLLSAERLAAELDALGYRPAGSPGLPAPGTYRLGDGVLEVHQRRFPTPAGPGGGKVLEIAWRGRRIDRLRLGGEVVPSALLDPPLLATYYGDDLEERRTVVVDELPEHVIEAVLAAEDARFFHHSGVSLGGMLRAAWVNLRGGEISQGGSTLTQQLVKNLYLTHERTLARKAREVVLALLLDARYDKRQILQAYLNEIYMGASDGVNLMGLGAAAEVYFGKQASELDLAEAATLAGMIRAPARYSPITRPEAARELRDQVLHRLAELERLPAEQVEAALARPVEVRPRLLERRGVPYFAAAAARETAERFGVDPAAAGGYTLLTTLEADDQRWAEEAVRWGMEALEGGWEKGHETATPLQAALVSIDPHDGGILAYVGGRDFAASQFDRAGQARRQAGSAFKPVVYAAAFEDGVAAPSSLIEDAPLTVRLASRSWSPRNDDGEFHGWVSVRTALERSMNVATARMALQVGLGRVVELAHDLGVSAPLEPLPALALGAFEVSPVEMATVYGTFAAGGRRPPVHGVVAVFDGRGRPLAGRPLPAPEQVLSPQAAFLVTSVLEGVLDRGTASATRRWGLEDPLAGKTGTTNGRRDSWFAGYSPGRATVVWVGYDDNAETRLSGSRAALPVWARFAARMRPAGGYPTFPQPPGVVTAVIDPASGELATDRCPQALTEVFLDGRVPDRVCRLHGGYWSEPLGAPDDWQRREDDRRRPGDDRRHPFRNWLKRVFGEGERR